MAFLDLPNETLLQIAEGTKSDKALCALTQTNRRLYNLLQDLRYKFNIRFGRCSALFWAVKKDNASALCELLHLGANANKKRRRVMSRYLDFAIVLNAPLTPLHLAARLGRLNMVHLLLDAGADPMGNNGKPTKTLLYNALFAGHEKVVLTIRRHMDTDDLALLLKGTAEGLTPLHLACRRGLWRSARFFVERGADVNATTEEDDLTPLHDALLARHNGRDPVKASDVHQNVKLLMDSGADQDILANYDLLETKNLHFDMPWTARALGPDHRFAEVRALFCPSADARTK